jgi:hypothetical protein
MGLRDKQRPRRCARHFHGFVSLVHAVSAPACPQRLILSLRSYIVLNLPYMVLSTILTPSSSPAKSARRWLGSTFFATLVPLVWIYLQHKVHRVSGGMLASPCSDRIEAEPSLPLVTAYSIYAIFEWSLIVLDVSFDSLYILDYPSSTSSPSAASPVAFSFSIESAPPQAAVETPAVPSNGFVSDLGRTMAKVEMATSGVRKFVAETYLSFAFFTLLVGLGPMIFYERYASPVILFLPSLD